MLSMLDYGNKVFVSESSLTEAIYMTKPQNHMNMIDDT